MTQHKIRIPKNALLVLVGASGSGKSTLAEKWFPGCVISSDECRRKLAGDIPSAPLQAYSDGAFILFKSWIQARLRHGLLTVADSTALRPEYRNDLAKIANEEHARVRYLFIDTPQDECLKRNEGRRDNDKVPDGVIRRQFGSLSKSRGWLRTNEYCYTIKPGDEVEFVLTDSISTIEAPAIDVIGDVHGCLNELVDLIEKLGYFKGGFIENEQMVYKHPEGRKLVFVGDLIDRGPEPYNVLNFVRRHVENGLAELVLSNHERKLRQFLGGGKVTIKEEFQKSLNSFPQDLDKAGLKAFLHTLRPYRTWTSPAGEPWVVAHAAFDPKFMGKMDGKIEAYCVYGPVNSVDPVTHMPDRIAWWETYKPGPKVAYGHIVTDDFKPRIVNGTYGIDTGCVHGGYLTALRLPEVTFTQVQARQVYFEKFLKAPDGSLVKEEKSEPKNIGLPLLRTGRLSVRGLQGEKQEIHIGNKEGLQEAVDQMSTKVSRPDKIVWLSPTMSPGPVSTNPNLMEDPVTAAQWLFDHAPAGTKLSVQVKHMGSRGIWLCEYRGKDYGWEITCWTRNGYEMFDDPMRTKVYEAMQTPLDEIASVMSRGFKIPEVLLLDSEVMPFNQHGPAWLEKTFMVPAAAGKVSKYAMARAAQLGVAMGASELNLAPLRDACMKKMQNLTVFGDVANKFCWPVASESDIKIGIFDVLRPSNMISRSTLINDLNAVLSVYPMFAQTETKTIENTPDDLQALYAWWQTLTDSGKEGLVLKYDDPMVWSNTKYPQQMLKVRGLDYLRIIYGPQYLEKDILAQLRAERKIDGKMRLAYQQALLGTEALTRFEEGRPFEEWHEMILGILAADRATVDPRL